MYDLNIRFPIASLLFLIVIGGIYIRNKRLPTVSTKAFSRMYVVMLFNILIEFGSVYSLCFFEQTPENVRFILHLLYIGSLNLLVMLFFIYALRLCFKSRRFKWWLSWITALPFIGAMLIFFFGEIEYYHVDTYVYSYGSIPNTIFSCIGLYLVLSISVLIVRRKQLEPSKKFPMWMALLFWIVGASIQLFWPTLLVSSIAGSGMIAFIYLSLENPRESYSIEYCAFNKGGFIEFAEEKFSKKSNFFVVTILLVGLDTVKTKFGHNVYEKFIATISRFISSKTVHSTVFHIFPNSLTVILPTQLEAAHVVDFVEKHLKQQSLIVEKVNCLLDPRTCILECPRNAKKTDEVINIIDYFVREYENCQCSSITIDDTIISNQQRYADIEDIIFNAIENDGFQVYYQPIFSTKENKFNSAEALIRLIDKRLGFISPDEFIPIAEHNSSILEIGRIVFEKVCRLASQRNLTAQGIDYIEVNLSGVQCMSTDLYYELKKTMMNYNIDPSFINLEITETAAIDSSETLLKNMELLRALGCTFSLDDFGTGFSNLTQVVSLPLRMIKLDKTLVWGYFDETKPKVAVLTYNIINMLKNLDLKIVAEGVETKEQADTLTAMHVDYLQGYYYSKPIPENDFLKFIGAAPLE